GGALLQCWDIGVALCAGLVASLYFRSARPGRILPFFTLLDSYARFGVGLMVVVGGFLGFTLLAFGHVPSRQGVADFLHVMTVATASGHGGARLSRFEPFALLILGHAVAALVHTALILRSRPLTFQTRMRGSVAAMLLVWFAYFANRPDPEYLV